MNTKQNVNENAQQVETQVTELGRATELTLGAGMGDIEPNGRFMSRFYRTTAQVTELGTASDLTLGFFGQYSEGNRTNRV